MSVIDHVASRGWRRRWLFVGGGSVAVLAVGAAVLVSALDTRTVLVWTALACPLVGWVTWFFYSRRDGPSVSSAIRPANAVTMVRGWLLAAVGGFVAVSPTAAIAWVPALCYGVAATLDQVDGRLARRTGTESTLGEQLDMAVDTLGFTVAPAVAVAWGRLPVWYLLLPTVQYLFKLGRSYRVWRDRPVCELSPSALRRNLAGLQMAFLTVALVPVVPTGPLAVVAAVVLAPSVSLFVRDYLVVAGYHRPGETA